MKSKCWIRVAFRRNSDGREMSTGKCPQAKCHRGVTWSCDSWWNPAILLDLSMLCWSDYNSCLKSLVSSKTNFFVIVQRGISKTSLKALDVVLLSTSDSLKLYQFTTQVAPPFSEQYLQEGSWQLTEYLIADLEIHRKKPTCERLRTTWESHTNYCEFDRRNAKRQKCPRWELTQLWAVAVEA